MLVLQINLEIIRLTTPTHLAKNSEFRIFKMMHSEPQRIKFLTFNTWGLKYVSKHRRARLRALAEKLAGHQNSNIKSLPNSEDLYADNDFEDYDIVALQEIWCKEDWDYIVEQCGKIFPYYRWFYSGILSGPGLAILSKIPIESTFLYRYPINGRPSAIHRGDWYVGKSIAITTLRNRENPTTPIVIMNSHMHAPYSLTGDAAYSCHRSCQAWDFAKLAKIYREAGYAVVIVGDLNSRPGSLPHNILTKEAGLIDSWEQLHGKQDLEKIRTMNAMDQLVYACTTCDSTLNTWRATRRPDEACRLDYALVDPRRLTTIKTGIKFTELIDGVGSFSDHFAYSCTLEVLRDNNVKKLQTELSDRIKIHEDLELCIEDYLITARKQKFLRGLHFWMSVFLMISCAVVTTFTSNVAGWSSIFWVLFAIVVAVTGVIDGMISFLFGRSEIRALWEVQHEVKDSKRYLEEMSA